MTCKSLVVYIFKLHVHIIARHLTNLKGMQLACQGPKLYWHNDSNGSENCMLGCAGGWWLWWCLLSTDCAAIVHLEDYNCIVRCASGCAC